MLTEESIQRNKTEKVLIAQLVHSLCHKILVRCGTLRARGTSYRLSSTYWGLTMFKKTTHWEIMLRLWPISMYNLELTLSTRMDTVQYHQEQCPDGVNVVV